MKLIKENMLLEKRWLKTIDGKVAKRFHQVLDNDDSQNAPQALKDLLDKILEVEPKFKEDYDNLIDELSALGSIEDYDNEDEFDSQFNYIVDLMYDYCDEHNIWIDPIYNDSDEGNKNEIDLDEALGLKENNNLSANNHINEDFDMDKFIAEHDDSFKYQLLDRMKGDCEYYISNKENDENNHLWGKSAKDHIEYMKKLYNSFDEKPEWLTMRDIENFEKRMLGNEKIIDESISEAKKKRLMKEIKSIAIDDYEVGHPQDPDDFNEFAHLVIDANPELGYYYGDEGEVVITDEATMHELWDYYWECIDELRGTLYESIDNPYSLKLSKSERSTAIKLAKEGINKLDPEKEYSEQELFNAMDPENNYEEEEYFWYAMFYLLDKGSLIAVNGKYKKANLDEKLIQGKSDAYSGKEKNEDLTQDMLNNLKDRDINFEKDKEAERQAKVELAKNGIETDPLNENDDLEEQIHPKMDFDHEAHYTVYKIIAERDFTLDDLKENELEVYGSSENIDGAIDLLNQLFTEENEDGVILDNETDEFIEQQEIDNYILHQDEINYEDDNDNFGSTDGWNI